MDIVPLLVLPLLLVFSLMTWHISTLRLLPGKIAQVDADDIPLPPSKTLAEAETLLTGLGFSTKSKVTRSAFLAGNTFGLYGTVMHHAETNTWAMAYVESPAHPILPWRLYFITPTDPSNIVTFSGGGHTADLATLGFDVEDAMQYLPTKQWEHHLNRLQPHDDSTNETLNLNVVIDQFNTLFFEGAVRTGQLIADNNSYRIPIKNGMGLYFSALYYYRKLMISKKKAVAEGLVTASSARGDYEAYLANKELLASKKLDSSKKIKFLAISVVVFALSFYFFASFETILIIVAVLFVHEAGHLLGMKLFGYKDLSMLFIPFLGALANGKKEQVSTWQEALILLSGPLPGYVAGIYILATQTESTPDWFIEYGWISFVINALNLLPFLPLDGGKIVSLALFNRLPFLQLGLTVLSIIAIGYFGLTTSNNYILIIPLFLIISLPTVWAETHLLRESLRLKLHQKLPDKETLIQTLSSHEQWKKLAAPTKWQVLDSLSFRLQHASTSMVSAGLIFVLWISTIAVPLTMAVPNIDDIFFNHFISESDNSAESFLHDKYDNAKSDADKAMFSERLAEHYSISNLHEAEKYWAISKELTFYGDMDGIEKGNRLQSLALSCEALEANTNCSENYFDAAIAAFSQSNATEELILAYQSAVDYNTTSFERSTRLLDKAEQTIGSRPEFIELLIANGVLRSQVYENAGKIPESKLSLKEATNLSMLNTPEYAYYEQNLFINFLYRHNFWQEAVDTNRAWIESNQNSAETSLYTNLNYIMAWLLVDTNPALAEDYLRNIIEVEELDKIELLVARAMLRQKQGLPFENKNQLNELAKTSLAEYWWFGMMPYVGQPFDTNQDAELYELTLDDESLLAVNWYQQLKTHLQNNDYQMLRELNPSE